MFLKTIWRQGNRIMEQNNVIKNLKEENRLLQDEIDFAEIREDGFRRKLKTIIRNGQANKRLYVDIISDIEKELADCESN